MISIAQTKTAIVPGSGNIAYFLASGGTPPYTYSVVAGGAGGTINATTGFYSSPSALSLDPKKQKDTIRVVDAVAGTVDVEITIGNPLLLFCEILRHELNLAEDKCWLWNQKAFQPSTDGLYIPVGIDRIKVIGNNSRINSAGKNNQYLYGQALLDLNVISRDNAALYRIEEVPLALESSYSQFQQETNGFQIAKIPFGAIQNISGIDGAAIPYRFHISVVLMYAVRSSKDVQYYDDFKEVQLTTNP